MSASDESGTELQVEPVEGYDMHWTHGLLRCGPAPSDRLVRLADVVRWLMRAKQLPFAVAVDEICNAITSDSVMHMYFVDTEQWARPVAKPTPWSQFFDDEKERDWPHPQRVASQCVKALRGTWQGDKFWLAKVVNDPEYAPNEYDPFTESLIDYSDRRGDSGATYAIRISKAHELWGWGSVTTAEVLLDAALSPSSAPAIEAQDVSDWPSLVRYRLQFANLPEQKRPVWLPEHVNLLAVHLYEEIQVGRRRGALERMGKALGYKRGERVSQLLKAAGVDVTKGKAPAVATVFDALVALSEKKFS